MSLEPKLCKEVAVFHELILAWRQYNRKSYAASENQIKQLSLSGIISTHQVKMEGYVLVMQRSSTPHRHLVQNHVRALLYS